MRDLFTLAALMLAVTDVSAHYIFQQLAVGSTKNPAFKYIRQNTNYNSPVTDLTSNDLRCNVGAKGSATETVTMKAGDSFTFYTDTAVYHQGPVSLYMSKAPGTAAQYDGSGGGFKIHEWGPTGFSGGQGVWSLSDKYTFNIPTCLSNGEYLLRIESIGIHNPYPSGLPQFYVSCAQIKLTGGGNANPPTVKIPGVFKESDPGLTANIYNNFNSYTIPGPAVWKCGDASDAATSGSETGSEGAAEEATPTEAEPTTFITSTISATPEVETPTCSTSKYGQCGGIGFSGCSYCEDGASCFKQNDYYSQCV